MIERQKKKDEFAMKIEENREAERVAREARFLQQQDEYLRMIKGFEETIRNVDKSAEKRDDALIEAFGIITKKLEEISTTVEEINGKTHK